MSAWAALEHARSITSEDLGRTSWEIKRRVLDFDYVITQATRGDHTHTHTHTQRYILIQETENLKCFAIEARNVLVKRTYGCSATVELRVIPKMAEFTVLCAIEVT